MSTLFAYEKRKVQAGKRKWKMIRTSALLMICFLMVAVTFLYSNVALGENDMPATIVVIEGDTLWAVARANVPRGMDIRDYIAEIQEVNGIVGAIVYPGQEIILP